jgi:PKD repeat protein
MRKAPTASISCPATAFVGEPVICDGSGSTNINGQVGWSVQQFSADATAPVAWDFGDNLGPYSKAELLRSTHVYLTAGTYTINFTGKNSGGASASTSTSITISDIPAATGGNIQTLTDQGSNTANVTALQNAINTAFANNTVEQEIRLPAITYQGQFTIPACSGQ